MEVFCDEADANDIRCQKHRVEFDVNVPHPSVDLQRLNVVRPVYPRYIAHRCFPVARNITQIGWYRKPPGSEARRARAIGIALTIPFQAKCIAFKVTNSRLHSAPLNLRERVLTIDHDSRISPRAPFERVLAVEQAIVSDIQAFGYNADDVEQATRNAERLALWYLVRQDLYLNDQATAFLIVHWKHTLNFISFLDVIPGDGTELISG
jgi:hypothetical protein